MKYKFTSEENRNILEFLSDKISGVSLNSFKQLLKNREIKINGARIDQNIMLECGDKVEVFVPASKIKNDITICYEDENIVVVDKPPLWTVEGGLTDFLKSKYPYAAPVHRLDRNTRGLVIFAKNKEAEVALLAAFKQRTICKKYRALTKGTPPEGTLKAYLFKDAKKSVCYVSDNPKTGYKEIITNCKIINTSNNISEVELTLITGRTHQLRAHMAHLNCPIIGDDKYGDHTQNKTSNAKYQQLTATSIKFTTLTPPLEYLTQKEITLNFSFKKEPPQVFFQKEPPQPPTK